MTFFSLHFFEFRFRTAFSPFKALFLPHLVEISMDRFNDSKFNFRSSMSSQTKLSLALMSKSSKSFELNTSKPSVLEAAGVGEAIKLAILFSYGGFLIGKSSSLFPSVSKILARRFLSIFVALSRKTKFGKFFPLFRNL